MAKRLTGFTIVRDKGIGVTDMLVSIALRRNVNGEVCPEVKLVRPPLRMAKLGGHPSPPSL